MALPLEPADRAAGSPGLWKVGLPPHLDCGFGRRFLWLVPEGMEGTPLGLLGGRPF